VVSRRRAVAPRARSTPSRGARERERAGARVERSTRAARRRARRDAVCRDGAVPVASERASPRDRDARWRRAMARARTSR
jgi:hypothetical protein